ncbi:F-box/FBD/LRR-repeat protein At1g16930-like isoform X1 [Trifolium pratense]|uniref:F-box/FBD/LRR-repeat protein At1g16930-like isoform X1 n=2 Tax=Trifolium pratense TaxID=57577 RepID=UPI001E694CDA|nr:F-box/FBD/LRR-repeat protein At1g16930-like isoform X1 [Trifolium pratense]XP_045815676.1 F-box/FBD/LRR-repeat protein At1g16930-like isoform X1 [Trifolium pratense]
MTAEYIVDKQPMMKTSMHRESEQEVDIISTLPDSIVTHIMEFLVTKEAVHTSILSKRWKHLWKSLAILIINSNQFDKAEFFKKFVLKVLQHRDYSSALRKIVVKHNGHIHFHILAKIINYAVSYEVEQFKLDTFLRNDVRNMLLFHPLFYLRSLKRLDVSLRKSGWIAQLPVTLDLPQLVYCHLRHFSFTSSDDKDFSNPFLNCKKLRTLVIDNCNLSNGKILCLVSDKLVNLTIRFCFYFYNPFKVTIYAPNLEAFTFAGRLNSTNNHEIFEHNLDFIGEANIDVLCHSSIPGVEETLKNWFRRISNVHSLSLCLQTLEGLSHIPDFPYIESMGFSKLKSVIVRRFAETVPLPKGVLDYLLQDSPLAERRIIQGEPLYSETYDLT